MKSISNMTLSEVMEKLREPLPKEAFSYKLGYPALKYRAVLKRLEEVVSLANYRFVIKKCEEVTVAGQPNVTTEGELTLLFDDGAVAFIAPAVGASRVTLSSESGEPINLANDREAAVHDCFKRCGKVLGIGTEQLEQMREVSVTAELLQNFTGRGSGIATRVRINNEEYDLVIWQNSFELLSRRYGTVREFMEKCNKGKNLCCKGKFGVYKGAKQFTFSGFDERGQS